MPTKKKIPEVFQRKNVVPPALQGKSQATPQEVSSKPAPKDETLKTFKDVKTGVPSGVTVGDKTFLGLNPSDIQKIKQGEEKKKALLEGTVPLGQAVQEQRTAEQNANLISQIGQLTPEQLNQELSKNPNAGLILQGGAGAIGGAVAGAGTGAATGAAIGSIVPGIGTAVGAGVGAVVGGIGGALSGSYFAISSNEKKDVKLATSTAGKAMSNMQFAVANAQVMGADNAVRLFNQALSDFRAADNLLRQENNSLSKFVNDGKDKEVIMEGNKALIPTYQLLLQQAISQPGVPSVVPNFIPFEDQNA